MLGYVQYQKSGWPFFENTSVYHWQDVAFSCWIDWAQEKLVFWRTGFFVAAVPSIVDFILLGWSEVVEWREGGAVTWCWALISSLRWASSACMWSSLSCSNPDSSADIICQRYSEYIIIIQWWLEECLTERKFFFKLKLFCLWQIR